MKVLYQNTLFDIIIDDTIIVAGDIVMSRSIISTLNDSAQYIDYQGILRRYELSSDNIVSYSPYDNKVHALGYTGHMSMQKDLVKITSERLCARQIRTIHSYIC